MGMCVCVCVVTAIIIESVRVFAERQAEIGEIVCSRDRSKKDACLCYKSACARVINFHIQVVVSIDFALVRMEEREEGCLVPFNPATQTSSSNVRVWRRWENRRERER